ncbi:MAG TPA: hypothetical protein VII29_18940 [Terriglobales bacterium]
MERKRLQRSPRNHDETFVIVMSITAVLGMVVALVLVFLWRNHPAVVTQSGAYQFAVALCPPFILVGVVSALTESTLAVVLTAGTIVFANGSLYAGVAALVYWALSIRRRRGNS